MTIPWTHLTGVPHLHLGEALPWLHRLVGEAPALTLLALAIVVAALSYIFGRVISA